MEIDRPGNHSADLVNSYDVGDSGDSVHGGDGGEGGDGGDGSDVLTGSCCCNGGTDRRWELISVGDGGITIKYLHSKYSQLTTEINNFPQIGDLESTLRAVTYRKTVGLIFKEKK